MMRAGRLRPRHRIVPETHSSGLFSVLDAWSDASFGFAVSAGALGIVVGLVFVKCSRVNVASALLVLFETNRGGTLLWRDREL